MVWFLPYQKSCPLTLFMGGPIIRIQGGTDTSCLNVDMTKINIPKGFFKAKFITISIFYGKNKSPSFFCWSILLKFFATLWQIFSRKYYFVTWQGHIIHYSFGQFTLFINCKYSNVLFSMLLLLKVYKKHVICCEFAFLLVNVFATLLCLLSKVLHNML